MFSRIVLAIPACNEAERLLPCLSSVAAQRGVTLPDIVVLLNNCTDGSADVVRRFAAGAPMRVHSIERPLPPHRASAGAARRLAMAHAARLAGPAGLLLTTDADTVLPPTWVANTLRAFRLGVDAVAGRAIIDPEEAQAIPQALHDADARECEYAALLDEIAALVDPDPVDPWPRHDEASGASLAVTVAAFRRAGGIPPVPLGEDRAFVAALRRIDGKLRHAPDVWVTVSGRIEGRAAGGMADTMRRRMLAADLMLDDRLEGAMAALRRARLRVAARAVHAGCGNAGALARALGLPHVAPLGTGYFGAAWEALEAVSPVLRRHRVPVAELPAQTAIARSLRDGLLSSAPADQADTVSAEIA